MNPALLVTVAGPLLGAVGWFTQTMWLFWIGVAVCSGQVISDSLIDFFDVDSRSKALGDKLPSFECSLMLL